MSDTPRTDAACGWPWGHHGRIECGDLRWSPDGPFVHSEVARAIERENAALRAELEAQAVVNGKGGEREAKLLAENAALRTALNDFRSLSFIALLAPVPDCRPHYDLVKKHWALLNNESTKEAQP